MRTRVYVFLENSKDRKFLFKRTGKEGEDLSEESYFKNCKKVFPAQQFPESFPYCFSDSNIFIGQLECSIFNKIKRKTKRTTSIKRSLQRENFNLQDRGETVVAKKIFQRLKFDNFREKRVPNLQLFFETKTTDDALQSR